MVVESCESQSTVMSICPLSVFLVGILFRDVNFLNTWGLHKDASKTLL